MKLPCVIMRGGTSRAPFFLEVDLPKAQAARDKVLIKAMGAGHPLQVDGVGGGAPQTSKVAIISKSNSEEADIDYLFAQVSVTEEYVDWSPNCGNILSAVAPFAIEAGLVEATHPVTNVLIYNVNTKALISSKVQTPLGKVQYDGDTAIDGVNGTAAPIALTFLDAAGSKTGALQPTGKAQELINDIPVTLIDYAMPMMLINASSLGLKGTETPAELEKNHALLAKMEAMRLEAGLRMELGDVSKKVVPKVGILSKAHNGGTLTSRYFMPHQCHKSHAVTGALCIAAAVAKQGTIANELASKHTNLIDIEHPTGKISVTIETLPNGDLKQASLLRTARRIFEGFIHV